MKFKKINKLCFCNICKKSFKDGFEVDLNKRFLNTIKICNGCAVNVYKDLGSYFVPKGIKNKTIEIKGINKNF